MPYTEEDINKFQSNILKPTDTFKFSCKMCGDCCRRRQQPIMLTGHDIFRISQALNLHPQQVVDEKTLCHLGDNSHIPILTLKERLDGSCSLLRKGKCIVHQSKPIVCALFPIGRMYNATTHEVSYFKNPHGCNSGSKDGTTWTLQDWLDEFNITDLDEASMIWNRLATGVSAVTSKISKDKITDRMIAIVGTCLYTNYDITKPYIQQARDNMVLLKLAFEKMFNLKIYYDS